MAVPQRGGSALLCLAAENGADLAAQAFQVMPQQNVRAHSHGNRALRAVAEGKAGDAQEGGLLLDSSRIGNDDRSALL